MCYYSLKSRPNFIKTKKNIEGHKNSLGLVINQKHVTVAILEKTAGWRKNTVNAIIITLELIY